MKERSLAIFMPARLGSERIRNKMILPLGTSCLWDMACKKLAGMDDRFGKYVLINEPELIKIASKYPSIKIIIRDKGTESVDGPLSYIFGGVAEIPATHLMFLNPCLSMLKAETIAKAADTFIKSNHGFATSVKEYKNWAFYDGEPITPIDYGRLTTKEIVGHQEAAHCFHIFNKEEFLENGNMLKPGMMLIDIDKSELMDIDTPFDYEVAKVAHSQRLCFDLDGTLCKTEGMNYMDAEPIDKAVYMVNVLYDAGNYIIIDTARGSGSNIDWYTSTARQLKEWGVKYHELRVGEKPWADKYIDDKGINAIDFFNSY